MSDSDAPDRPLRKPRKEGEPIGSKKENRSFYFAAFGVLALSGLFVARCTQNSADNDAKTITAIEFDSIKDGMTIDEVETLVGDKPTKVENARLGATSVKVFWWDGVDDSSTYGRIAFSEGLVVQKFQHGLK